MRVTRWKNLIGHEKRGVSFWTNKSGVATLGVQLEHIHPIVWKIVACDCKNDMYKNTYTSLKEIRDELRIYEL